MIDDIPISKICNILFRFCSGRERCEQEVEKKLTLLGISDKAFINKIIGQLKEEGFLDNKRFARAYCLDKFRFNRWGRIKLNNMLYQYNLGKEIIDYGISCIEEEEYVVSIKQLIDKQYAIVKKTEKDKGIIKNKVIRYLVNKGFEYEIIKSNYNK